MVLLNRKVRESSRQQGLDFNPYEGLPIQSSTFNKFTSIHSWSQSSTGVSTVNTKKNFALEVHDLRNNQFCILMKRNNFDILLTFNDKLSYDI